MYGPLIILGACGFAREVFCYTSWYGYNGIYLYDEFIDQEFIRVAGHNVPTLKNFGKLSIWHPRSQCVFVVGVGNPDVKEKLVSKALTQGLKPAPTIVAGGVGCHDHNKIGFGGVICPGVQITTNVTIGDYVTLNLNTTIGHDAVIEDFVTTSPGCHISGNVVLSKKVFLGSGAVVKEKVKVAEGVTIGAQAYVAKDALDEGVTLVGVPAKKLEKQ